MDSRGDGSICEAAWREGSVVLIAYGSTIRQVRQNFSDYTYTTLVEDESSVRGSSGSGSFVLSMDVDPLSRHVYWIDEASQQIKRSFIPVSKTALGHAQLLISLSDETQSVNSMIDFTAVAVDWLAKNLYYAEGLNGTIKVSKTDGRYERTLISVNAERVYSLVVNPVLG